MAVGRKRQALKAAGAGDGVAGDGADSEKNRVIPAELLQQIAERTIEQNLAQIVGCVLVNIKAGHLPSVKLLFELAQKLQKGEYVPEREYMSLAAQLLKFYQELECPAVQGDVLEAGQGQLTDGNTFDAETRVDAEVG